MEEACFNLSNPNDSETWNITPCVGIMTEITIAQKTPKSEKKINLVFDKKSGIAKAIEMILEIENTELPEKNEEFMKKIYSRIKPIGPETKILDKKGRVLAIGRTKSGLVSLLASDEDEKKKSGHHGEKIIIAIPNEYNDFYLKMLIYLSLLQQEIVKHYQEYRLVIK